MALRLFVSYGINAWFCMYCAHSPGIDNGGIFYYPLYPGELM